MLWSQNLKTKRFKNYVISGLDSFKAIFFMRIGCLLLTIWNNFNILHKKKHICKLIEHESMSSYTTKSKIVDGECHKILQYDRCILATKLLFSPIFKK